MTTSRPLFVRYLGMNKRVVYSRSVRLTFEGERVEIIVGGSLLHRLFVYGAIVVAYVAGLHARWREKPRAKAPSGSSGVLP